MILIVTVDLPRKLREDDVYNGYHLEKDSLVIVNIWYALLLHPVVKAALRIHAPRSILHDEKVYPEPETFNPDRFLEDGRLNRDILDPQDVAFGFGRRICPGRYMAYDTIWITIATILVCTEIGFAKDSAGKDITVKEDYISAFVTFVPRFPIFIHVDSHLT